MITVLSGEQMLKNKTALIIVTVLSLSFAKGAFGSKSMDFSKIVATDFLELSGGDAESAKANCRQQYGEGSKITDQVCNLIDQYARIE